MPHPSAVDACMADLFTDEQELRRKYPDSVADRVMRVREMYNWFLSEPDASDRRFVEEICSRRKISKVTAYADLEIVKTLLPKLSENSREFHRWRYTQMILDTFAMAKARKDTKTMERAATSYAKYTRVDLENERKIPYDLIMWQPFTATEDPSVLGIKPIPNLRQKINSLIEKYRRETIDIDDVEAEDIDLELPDLLPAKDSPEQDVHDVF